MGGRAGDLEGLLTSRRVVLAGGLLLLTPAVAGWLLFQLGWLPADPAAFVGPPNAPPSARFWLGTDALGRDLLSRLAAGAAGFAGPGLLGGLVAVVLGGALGLAEGLAPRPLAAAASWGSQTVDSVPKLVLVLLVAAISGSQLYWIMTAVGVTFVPLMAAGVKSSIDRLKATAFIEAERSLGVGLAEIALVHILWGHARHVLLAQISGLLAYALLVESSLSYLGGELGVQEPAASWGNMIALAREGIFRGYFLPALAPALLISLTLLGFGLLGRGVVAKLEERL